MVRRLETGVREILKHPTGEGAALLAAPPVSNSTEVRLCNIALGVEIPQDFRMFGLARGAVWTTSLKCKHLRGYGLPHRDEVRNQYPVSGQGWEAEP